MPYSRSLGRLWVCVFKKPLLFGYRIAYCVEIGNRERREQGENVKNKKTFSEILNFMVVNSAILY